MQIVPIMLCRRLGALLAAVSRSYGSGLATMKAPRTGFAIMDLLLHQLAEIVAFAIEIVVVAILAFGCAMAALNLARMTLGGFDQEQARAIWIRLASAILIALEFALAADLVRTVIAPSWDAIGKLAAIAAIRTLLSIFLARDIEAFSRREAGTEPARDPQSPGRGTGHGQ